MAPGPHLLDEHYRGHPEIIGRHGREGYPLAIAAYDMAGGRIDVAVNEFPRGDPRGRTQRQLAARDANQRKLGWTVVRRPAWEVCVDPAAIAEHVRELVLHPPRAETVSEPG